MCMWEFYKKKKSKHTLYHTSRIGNMILLLIYMTYGDVVLLDKRSFPRTKILHTKIHYTIFERVMRVIHRLQNAIIHWQRQPNVAQLELQIFLTKTLILFQNIWLLPSWNESQNLSWILKISKCPCVRLSHKTYYCIVFAVECVETDLLKSTYHPIFFIWNIEKKVWSSYRIVNKNFSSGVRLKLRWPYLDNKL